MKPPPIRCTKQSIASFCPVTICSVETGEGEGEGVERREEVRKE